jgi:hypothetical protein
MHILFVIPHYVRMPDAAARAGAAAARPLAHPTLSCMAKIAALGDTLAALMSHFGGRRHDLEGDAITAPHSADIVLVTQQGANVLPYLDYAAITETVTVEGDPMSIPWHCHDQLRARRGAYDWYCYLEDDIVIHDPGFFDKLVWFQAAFGPKAVLQPTIYELSRTGVPAKVVIAPRLNEFYGRPFRREGQAKRLRQRWLDREVAFEIPDNPHSPSFFLSPAQMDMLVAHPSYGDRDSSWIDPMVSAATLAIGKVFDLYKALEPDRFFLEAEHYGVRYSGRFAPFDVRYGDEPMLAIAEAALRSLATADHAPDAIAQLLELACSVGGSVSRQAVEERALGVISAHRTEYAAERDRALTELAAERTAREALERSPRRLARALAAALARRFQP